MILYGHGITEVMPCYFDPMMTVEELFSIPSNQGDTVNFYTCGKCFAAVQRQDRQQHAEWHEFLRRAIDEDAFL